jgi:hypothetical protein
MNMMQPVEPQREPPNFRPARKTRNVAGPAIIVLVVISWIVLFAATDQPLLASMQLAFLGMGGLVTAAICVLWRQGRRTS